jgi:dTMP kinase
MEAGRWACCIFSSHYYFKFQRKAAIAMDRQADNSDPDEPSGEAGRADRPRGKFITFEGGEGAGKSTQAATLAEHLKTLGIEVLLTREPGGSPGAEIIRHVILSGAAKPLGPDAEAMLFAAAREDHVKCAIEPALAAGKWVVCDRFADSTRVYQGALGQVDQRLIKGLERVSIGALSPDLTLVLDLPAETGRKRQKQRRGKGKPDRFEAENEEFHQKLRQAYLALAAAEPQRCIVIDANRAKQKVAKQIWAVVTKRLDPDRALSSVKNPAA